MAKRNGRDAQVSGWEWLLAALSAALILGILSFLVVLGVRDDGGAPVITTAVVQTRAVGERYLVTVELRNRGESTAADLQLEAALLEGDRVVERSRATLDYLPPGGRRTAGFFFERDPRARRLRTRLEGYQQP